MEVLKVLAGVWATGPENEGQMIQSNLVTHDLSARKVSGLFVEEVLKNDGDIEKAFDSVCLNQENTNHGDLNDNISTDRSSVDSAVGNSPNQLKGLGSLRKISREEVQENCQPSSCWIIVHDKVYNMTPFLNQHPGGAEMILEHAGFDATRAFCDVGHSIDATNIMKDYCIGILDEDTY